MPSLVLLLGGRGTRFGGKKQFLTYRGKYLFEYLLERVEDLFSEIVLVVPKEDVDTFRGKYTQYKIAVGGSERQYSVFSGLKLVSEPVVTVHDGARPLASRRLFEEAINLGDCDGRIPTIPLRDTVKRVSPDGVVLETIPRKELAAVQTPQGFKTEILLKCHERALRDQFLGTDDASLLERYGYKVCTFEGDPKNLKITYPSDWEIVKCLLGSGNS